MFKNLLFIILASAISLSASANPTAWSKIKHVVIIVFENTPEEQVIQQPFFKHLASQGAMLTQSYGVIHPSQPNYLALIGGDTFKASDDNITVHAKHLGNLLTAVGKDWRAYAEGYPGHCFLGAKRDAYYRKHLPFLSFNNVSSNPKECAKVLSSATFKEEIKNNNLTEFTFYTPDINNDGHDTNIAYADQYFAQHFGDILSDPKILADTLFIITFDEDDYKGSNGVYTVFLGAGVKAGSETATRYDHYSVLKTIEAIFGLKSLGRQDEKAKVIEGIWQD